MTVGSRVVLKSLPYHHGTSRENVLPVTIGLITSLAPLRARLRIGNAGSGVRWNPKSRPIELGNVVRIATPRECATGFVNRDAP